MTLFPRDRVIKNHTSIHYTTFFSNFDITILWYIIIVVQSWQDWNFLDSN